MVSKWYHGRIKAILGSGGSRTRESSNGYIFANCFQSRKVLLNKIIDRQMEMNDLDKTLKRLSDIRIVKPSEEDLQLAHNHYIKWQMENPNNFSYWFPKVAPHLEEKGIRSPKSKVIQVPENIMNACFMERKGDYELISEWIRVTVMPELLGAEFPLFMKNGCFSNKFDFNKSCRLEAYDEEAITKNFVNLQGASLLFDTGGNMEIVFREFIQPQKGTRTIYNGMPFRPEMRVFYDFDKHSYCYAVNYWDWDYCHERIAENAHDKEVYEAVYPELKDLYEYRKHYFLPRILSAFRRVRLLTGIWSADFILDEHRAWFIDMAVANRSAYWDEKWAEKGLS